MYGLENVNIIKQQNKGRVPIDQLWNVYDKGFFEWYEIPGFNGYQVSCRVGTDDHFIRSYKFIKQYPYGILVFPINGVSILNKDHDNIIYRLSDNDNMRIHISLKDILEIVKSNPGYPYPTQYIPSKVYSPRNKRIFINQDPDLVSKKKGLVKKSAPVNYQENTKMVTFTVSNNPKPLI